MSTAKNISTALQLDENGLLVNSEDWDQDIAIKIASQLGISHLTSDHWKIIDILRLHYARFGVAPAIHNVCHSNHESRDWVHKHFHNCLNAWRVAGLPDPGEEAKSYLSDM